MANKYPYVASAGPLIKAVEHLRKSFPKEVTADTLRKLGVAPKNESYVINVLRFLGVIDDEGKKAPPATVFVQHDDKAFAGEFAKLVREAYEELFELRGDAAWALDRNALTQFFRTTDHSSDVVGTRQAGTFAALAALSGHAEAPIQKAAGSSGAAKKASKTKAAPSKPSASDAEKSAAPRGSSQDLSTGRVGLTVRIEVNLPAGGDQATYDAIFQSIRKNFIDGK